tara:strand:- start:187 stop:1206 length:1020 start_codon:yes stop_codon:yes gene_type:complete
MISYVLFMIKKLLIIILFVLFTKISIGSELKLQILKNKDSVCNDGKNANYWIANQNSKKWLIHLPGGGGAWNEKSFIDRDKYKKESINKSKNYSEPIKSHSALGSMLFEQGYNVIKVHYCSSDMYAGNHTNKIEGKNVPFKGRKIIEEIFSIHQKDLNSATDVIVAGQSAGTYGVVLNLDLWNSLPNTRYILDAAWRDSYQLSIQGDAPSDEWVSFTLGEMPEHCNGNFYQNCNIRASTLNRFKIKDAFIIFNFGDPYNLAKEANQKEPFFKSIKKDMEYFSGGFAVDAPKYKLEGAIKWGHGLLGQKEYFEHKVEGTSLSYLLNEWVNETNDPVFIAY